jgi:hypothetical protein
MKGVEQILIHFALSLFLCWAYRSNSVARILIFYVACLKLYSSIHLLHADENKRFLAFKLFSDF